MHVVRLTEKHDGVITTFLDELGAESPSVLGYHYPFYRDALTTIPVGEPTSFGLFEGGDLVGMLPGVTKRSELGTVFSSLPFFGANAGVLFSERAVSRDRAHSELLSAAHDALASEPDPIAATYYTPFLSPEFSPYEAALGSHLHVERTTQWQRLADEEWSSKIRYDVRFAVRSGVEISTDCTPALVDAFYDLYVANCTDAGIPVKPRSVINRILDDRDSDRVSWHVAILDGAVIGGLIALWGPRTGSYYIPCTAAHARSLQPGTLLLDRALREARDRGVTHWNWEGSPGRESGVYRFKKKWGAVEAPFRIYVERHRPDDQLRSLSPSEIATAFPYFFVYPFGLLGEVPNS